ncbi:metalloprotease [Rhizoctonia solani]|nr:metalloprotease [Rhizoctonia solani]
MLFKLATLATLVISFLPALAQSSEGQLEHCASNPSKEKIKAAEASFIAKKKASKTSQLDFSAVIPVHWYAIQAGQSLEEGHIPGSQINDSIAVLNADYKPAGISFKLVSSKYITNETWFNWAGPEPDLPQFTYQTAMKKALRQGDASTLNLYTTSFANTTNPALLGYATFPDDYRSAPTEDGVVIRYSTLPGGSSRFNLGKTLTHEVGHWLGLLHTFSDDCDDDGDMVSDTPAQLNQTSGCPSTPPDTCPGQPGLDPIHNFMDYSDDICLLEFTPGQIQRMREQFTAFRSGSV